MHRQEKEGVGMKEMYDARKDIITGGQGSEGCHREDIEGKLAGVDGGGGDDGGEDGLNTSQIYLNCMV